MPESARAPPRHAIPESEGPLPDMIRVPGGTFRMGSHRHDPEEAPVHRVSVDPFWIDCTPMTNRQFRKCSPRACRRGRKVCAQEYPRAQGVLGRDHLVDAGYEIDTDRCGGAPVNDPRDLIDNAERS